MMVMKTAILLVTANIVLLVAVVVVLAFNTRTWGTHFSDTHADVIDAQLIAVSAGTVSENNYPREWAASQEVNGSLWKAAAHLVIDPRRNYTDTLPVLNWREDSNRTYVGNDIVHNAGSLTVQEGGYYFIYSQILYRGEGTRELEYGRLQHIVLKQRMSKLPESPTPLMRNLMSTPSIRRGHLTYASSVLGATFYLDPHSRLTVQSSVPGNIDMRGSPYSNVFDALCDGVPVDRSTSLGVCPDFTSATCST